MENLNKTAVSEVIEILNHTEREITEKIPEKFFNFLYENADSEYIPHIDFYDNNWEDKIQEDAKLLLALIYRDYIVPESERLELLQEENDAMKKEEQLLREKYNPDNVFKNNTQHEQEENVVNNTQLVVIQHTPWYQRLYLKILAIFGIHKNNN